MFDKKVKFYTQNNLDPLLPNLESKGSWNANGKFIKNNESQNNKDIVISNISNNKITRLDVNAENNLRQPYSNNKIDNKKKII